MAFKASELVAFCKSMVGQKYWYGTCVYPCTESKLQSKAKQYPKHYKPGRMPTYRKHIAAGLICMDCVGMIKGFFWTNGGKGVLEYLKTGKAFTNKYKANGCPDKSANGMLDHCKAQGCKNGKISTLPDVPGVLLFCEGHVGVYIGGGYAIEARGYEYGVVKTKVSERSWTHWAYMPESLLDYDGKAAEVQPEPEKVYKLGKRILKYEQGEPLMTGADVKELQTRLNALGHDCGKADGEFGKNTEKGVKSLQKAAGIEVDGEFGSQSLKALKAAEAAKTASYEVYTVQKDDTLWDIAKDKLGSGNRYKEIMELNNMASDVIHTGDKLKIPKK